MQGVHSGQPTSRRLRAGSLLNPVYAPEFEPAAERAAVAAEARKDDPYLLGYFLGNELPWPGRESVAADAILAGSDSPLQRELKKYLAAKDSNWLSAWNSKIELTPEGDASLERHRPISLSCWARIRDIGSRIKASSLRGLCMTSQCSSWMLHECYKAETFVDRADVYADEKGAKR
jgi:hypothetical protein